MTSFKFRFFLLLLPFSAFGQNVNISGDSPELAGFSIVAGRYENPISGKFIELDEDTVNAEGQFQLSFDTKEIDKIWLMVNRFSAPIFVMPDRDYSIKISPSREFVLIPAWRPGSFEYFFTDPDTSDINAEIIDFDQSYYSFFNQNAQLLGTPALRKKVKEFESENDLIEEGFLADYIRYSIAEMKLMAGFAKNELFQLYIENEELKFSNPSYYSFFNAFYANYFDRYDVTFGGASISNRLANKLGYEELDSLFLRDDFLQRDDIRQWVMLKSIKESIYLKNYSGDKLAAILNEIEMNAHSESIKQAAQNIRTDYLNATSNDFFEIVTEAAELLSDSLPTFIVVTLNETTEWKRESSFLGSLQQEYGDYFQILELFPDEERQIEDGRISLRIKSPRQLMSQLDIYQLPWYGWLSKSGELTRNINKPSEGLEERLYSIRAKALQEQKIKVGQ